MLQKCHFVDLGKNFALSAVPKEEVERLKVILREVIYLWLISYYIFV